MFQRTFPGSEPSAESYAISQRSYEMMRGWLHAAWFDDRAVDLFTAITTGLVSQPLANDPGGDRYERLTDEAVDMFLNHFGVQKNDQRKRRKR